MRLEESRGRERFPRERAAYFDVNLAGQGLSQVQDAAEKTGFLVVIVTGLPGWLELKFPVADSRCPGRRQRRPVMVMQRSRTDVDHEVSGQGDERYQAVMPRNHRFAFRLQPKPSSALSVLPSTTQFRQGRFPCQVGGQDPPKR
jgi:hypothetical protein